VLILFNSKQIKSIYCAQEKIKSMEGRMSTDPLWETISYETWLEQAERIAQEEFDRQGWHSSLDSIMRRAEISVLERKSDYSLVVQQGWQRAMRGK
jgi:hypothetical protein